MKTAVSAIREIKRVGTSPTHLSATDLSEILGVTKRAVIKRSNAENWPFRETLGNGGLTKFFAVNTLPSDIQRNVSIHFGQIPEDFDERLPVGFDAAKVARCTTAWDAALDWQKTLARKRLEILQAWEAFRAGFKGTMKTADIRFVEMFGNREIPGVDPVTFATIKKLKRSALHEWRQRFNQNGIAGLISQHGHNRGQTKLPLEQQNFILGTFNANPNLKTAKIATILRGKFNGESVSARSVREFLRRQRKANPQLFAFLDNPDGWKSKHQLALGSASEKATHFLHYVEVDSTIADVICSDGKRYNICGLIDIFSRKCKFLVTKTSSSWAIAGLLRNTIMDWGIPENLIRDNGKDYGSQTILDACLQLEINDIAVPPFTPEAKPHIERIFGTLTRDLFEALPGYCGHSVAERKAIDNRMAFADHFGQKQKVLHTANDDRRKYSPCAEHLTPQDLQEAIDRWVEQVYHLRTHGTLGTSPNVKAASIPVRPRRIEDARSLDILLAPAPKGETRTVLKDGVHLDGQLYWHDELIDWIGRKVRVKLDMHDAGRIFCFDPEFKHSPAQPDKTAFICEALDLSISGITIGDMIAAKKRARKRVHEGVKAMKTLAAEVGDPLAEEVRQIREERATVTNLRVGNPVEGNPFVDAANKAAAALDSPTITPDSEPNSSLDSCFDGNDNSSLDPRVLRFVTEAEEQEIKLYFKNYRERFEWLKEAQRHRELRSDETRWLRTYIDQWLDYAEMFSEKWPEGDRLWLGNIAPDHFPQYAIQEESR